MRTEMSPSRRRFIWIQTMIVIWWTIESHTQVQEVYCRISFLYIERNFQRSRRRWRRHFGQRDTQETTRVRYETSTKHSNDEEDVSQSSDSGSLAIRFNMGFKASREQKQRLEFQSNQWITEANNGVRDEHRKEKRPLLLLLSHPTGKQWE